MNLIMLTNARTGRPVAINPSVIGDVQERLDTQYPKTKVALVKTDGNFIPIAETIEVVLEKIAQASMSGARRQSVMRPDDPSDLGPQER